jgi:phosphatidylinositol alpha-1,6-mannosyltransferase
MTRNYCQELARRPEVRAELLLPKSSEAACVPPAVTPRRVLPEWVASFYPSVQRVVPFLFPRLPLQADVIHAFVEFPYSVLAWRLSRRLARPFLVTAHGTYGVAPFERIPDRWLYRRALSRSSTLVAVSRFTLDAMTRAGAILSRALVLPNPVDYERFQTPVPAKRFADTVPLPPNSRVILSVGAIKPRKGFDILLRAFASVTREEARTHLVIVGSGDTGALREEARRLGVEDRVHVAGAVGDDELVGLYQRCDVFALLPRKVGSHFEGFGLVYAEAGACGKPVVGTRTGGVPEAIVEGQTGLIVSEEDPTEASAALLRLLRDPDLASRLGAAGRASARERSWPRYVDQMLELYREALQVEGPAGVLRARPPL